MTSHPSSAQHDRFEQLFDVASAAARLAAVTAASKHPALSPRSARALAQATQRGTSAAAIEMRRRLNQQHA